MPLICVDRLRDRGLHLRRILAAPLEPALDDLFLAGAFRDSFRIGLRPAREVFQRGNDALEFRVEILVLEWRQLFERDLEDVPIGAGRDREFVIVIAEKKGARLEMDLQFAPLQHTSVLIAQNREQNLVLQIRL